MAAIFNPPDQLGPELGACPPQRLSVARRGRGHDPFTELAAGLIDGDEGVRALVDIGSNNNHGGCLLH